MSINIAHNGVYTFSNYKYPNGQVLNAYGTSNLANGRNVMLYDAVSGDKAQQWRVRYAGTNNGTKLYWMNCELGGVSTPYALDRFTGSSLKNNAHVYRTIESDASAADNLVYFQEYGTTGKVFIRLYSDGRALAAAANPNGTNGNNAPSALESAGNVYWKAYSSTDTAQVWTVTTISSGSDPTFTSMATTFPVASFYNSTNNSSYPLYVGECTWYCRGKFHQAHGIKNVCSGDAYAWKTNAIASGASRDTTSLTLRAQSVAVFGAGGSSPKGHVVFIESVSSSEVTWSDCNGSSNGGTLTYSNGQIEVPCSTLTGVTDGKKRTTPISTFKNMFGAGLVAIIYK